MPARGDIVLMFAYHYPPDPAIGGARPYRFAKYLRRLGYRVHVITAAAAPDGPEPDVAYLPDPFYQLSKDPGWQLERLVRRFLLPGANGLRWAVRAAALARRVIRDNPGRRITVVSTYPPVGAHLAGWLAASSRRVRWIADFRDPMGDWTILEGFATTHKISLAILERVFLRRAAAIIANTDSSIDHYHWKYPRKIQDLHLIWNGFDPEQRFHAIACPGRPWTVLTHTGELYYGRTATPILHSLQRLFEAGRLCPDRIRIRLIGSASSTCLPDAAFLDRAQQRGWLELVREVPRAQAVTAMRESDALLLIQPHSKIQVPGKMFEYLLTGHPILAFVPRDSPVERILEKSGVAYRCVHPEDSQAETDDAIAEFFAIPLQPTPPSAWFEENFNGERQAEQLHRIIDTLHSGS